MAKMDSLIFYVQCTVNLQKATNSFNLFIKMKFKLPAIDDVVATSIANAWSISEIKQMPTVAKKKKKAIENPIVVINNDKCVLLLKFHSCCLYRIYFLKFFFLSGAYVLQLLYTYNFKCKPAYIMA